MPTDRRRRHRPPTAVVFDLGNVLVHWDPRHLYRQLLDEETLEQFLGEVCTREWNHALDLGRPFVVAVEELCAAHPDQRALIEAYHQRWMEMVPGPVPGMDEVVRRLHQSGVPMYLLTNSSAEKFPLVLERFDFLRLLSGAVVSGAVGVAKPDPGIFELACARFRLDPGQVLFVDDLAPNVEAARRCGLQALQFSGADQLQAHLGRLGMLEG
ncbi:MAG TPA: HAD family phosphatase [Acidimicrobiales bacterium]|nr:HAD family phosphatase [Acidimicrobiales bacterium]